MTETITTDVLVIGGGGAASRAGLEASNLGVNVTLVDKGRPGNSGSSPPCLHGISSTMPLDDSPYTFYQDWVKVGGGISDQNLIWESVNGASANIAQLMESGMDFEREPGGKYFLYRGAGHSRARNLTIKQKTRGANLMTVLADKMKQRGGRILEEILITKLLKIEGAVRGAVGISSQGDFYIFKAKAVVLACGGANRIFSCVPVRIRNEKYRTTGDAFWLAFYAGAPIIDLEFSNFRESPPGASRGGGKYLNARGERFMERYDPIAMEKAPRQLTVAAIYTELREGRGPIYWEIDEKLLGLDPYMSPLFRKRKEIKVSIDFQRLLGGVRINERAETDVPHLYAAGESAGGLHGADRMQGNGFLDTQIFGARAGCNAAKLALMTSDLDIDMGQVKEETARIKRIKGDIMPSGVKKDIQKMMLTNVGIIRSADSLSKAMAIITKLKREQIPKLSGENIFSAVECMNMLLTAEMITNAALKREESRGSHRRSDFPDRNDNDWQKHIAIKNADGEIVVTTLPVQTKIVCP